MALFGYTSSSSRGKQEFTVCINEGEIYQIKEWVKKYPNTETGGDLFGAWIDDRTAVVQFVLGPGRDCRRTSVSFFQKIEYLRDAGSYLTQQHGLCNIGQWHSHHRLGLTQPSGGDKNTVWGNMPNLGLNRYIVFIATIGSSGSYYYDDYGSSYTRSYNHTEELTVNINPYLFEIKDGHRNGVLHGSIQEMKRDSPFRLDKAIQDTVKVGAESINKVKINGKRPHENENENEVKDVTVKREKMSPGENSDNRDSDKDQVEKSKSSEIQKGNEQDPFDNGKNQVQTAAEGVQDSLSGQSNVPRRDAESSLKQELDESNDHNKTTAAKTEFEETKEKDEENISNNTTATDNTEFEEHKGKEHKKDVDKIALNCEELVDPKSDHEKMPSEKESAQNVKESPDLIKNMGDQYRNTIPDRATKHPHETEDDDPNGTQVESMEVDNEDLSSKSDATNAGEETVEHDPGLKGFGNLSKGVENTQDHEQDATFEALKREDDPNGTQVESMEDSKETIMLSTPTPHEEECKEKQTNIIDVGRGQEQSTIDVKNEYEQDNSQHYSAGEKIGNKDQVETSGTILVGDAPRDEHSEQSNIPQGDSTDNDLPAEDDLNEKSNHIKTTPKLHEGDEKATENDQDSGTENDQDSSQMNSAGENFQNEQDIVNTDGDTIFSKNVSRDGQGGQSNTPQGDDIESNLEGDLNEKSKSSEIQKGNEQDPFDNGKNQVQTAAEGIQDSLSGQSNVPRRDAESSLKQELDESNDHNKTTAAKTEFEETKEKDEEKMSNNTTATDNTEFEEHKGKQHKKDVDKIALNCEELVDPKSDHEKMPSEKESAQNVKESPDLIKNMGDQYRNTIPDRATKHPHETEDDDPNGTQVESMEVDNEDLSSKSDATNVGEETVQHDPGLKGFGNLSKGVENTQDHDQDATLEALKREDDPNGTQVESMEDSKETIMLSTPTPHEEECREKQTNIIDVGRGQEQSTIDVKNEYEQDNSQHYSAGETIGNNDDDKDQVEAGDTILVGDVPRDKQSGQSNIPQGDNADNDLPAEDDPNEKSNHTTPTFYEGDENAKQTEIMDMDNGQLSTSENTQDKDQGTQDENMKDDKNLSSKSGVTAADQKTFEKEPTLEDFGHTDGKEREDQDQNTIITTDDDLSGTKVERMEVENEHLSSNSVATDVDQEHFLKDQTLEDFDNLGKKKDDTEHQSHNAIPSALKQEGDPDGTKVERMEVDNECLPSKSGATKVNQHSLETDPAGNGDDEGIQLKTVTPLPSSTEKENGYVKKEEGNSKEENKISEADKSNESERDSQQLLASCKTGEFAGVCSSDKPNEQPIEKADDRKTELLNETEHLLKSIGADDDNAKEINDSSNTNQEIEEPIKNTGKDLQAQSDNENESKTTINGGTDNNNSEFLPASKDRNSDETETADAQEDKLTVDSEETNSPSLAGIMPMKVEHLSILSKHNEKEYPSHESAINGPEDQNPLEIPPKIEASMPPQKVDCNEPIEMTIDDNDDKDPKPFTNDLKVSTKKQSVESDAESIDTQPKNGEFSKKNNSRSIFDPPQDNKEQELTSKVEINVTDTMTEADAKTHAFTAKETNERMDSKNDETKVESDEVIMHEEVPTFQSIDQGTEDGKKIINENQNKEESSVSEKGVGKNETVDVHITQKQLKEMEQIESLASQDEAAAVSESDPQEPKRKMKMSKKNKLKRLLTGKKNKDKENKNGDNQKEKKVSGKEKEKMEKSKEKPESTEASKISASKDDTKKNAASNKVKKRSKKSQKKTDAIEMLESIDGGAEDNGEQVAKKRKFRIPKKLKFWKSKNKNKKENKADSVVATKEMQGEDENTIEKEEELQKKGKGKSKKSKKKNKGNKDHGLIESKDADSNENKTVAKKGKKKKKKSKEKKQEKKPKVQEQGKKSK